MPNCTVRYHVRLLPSAPDARAMDAVAIFTEERVPDEHGEPGMLLSRHLSNFSGPGGDSVRRMVTEGAAWHMDVQDRIGPLEWDGVGYGEERSAGETGRQARAKGTRRKWLF